MSDLAPFRLFDSHEWVACSSLVYPSNKPSINFPIFGGICFLISMICCTLATRGPFFFLLNKGELCNDGLSMKRASDRLTRGVEVISPGRVDEFAITGHFCVGAFFLPAPRPYVRLVLPAGFPLGTHSGSKARGLRRRGG
jgi:hypothetical protein